MSLNMMVTVPSGAAFDPLRLQLERQRPLREQLHPQLLGHVQRLGQQAQRLLTVAAFVALDEHIGVLALGPRQYGAGAHSGVYFERVLEMAFGLFPAGHRRGEQTQVPRSDAEAGGGRAQNHVALCMGK
jgi:hypothetical protein